MRWLVLIALFLVLVGGVASAQMIQLIVNDVHQGTSGPPLPVNNTFIVQGGNVLIMNKILIR